MKNLRKIIEIIKEDRLPCLLIIFGAVFFCADKFFNWGMSGSNWIYFATFLALLWYAEETKKIREIEQEPIIDLYYRPEIINNPNKEKNHPKYLRLRNSGKGTAYNIKVEKIISENGSKEFEFYFEDPNLILMNNTEQTLLVESIHNHEDEQSYQADPLADFLSYIKEQNAKQKKKTKIIVSYENYLQKKFERQFYFYCRLYNDKAKYLKEFEVEFIK